MGERVLIDTDILIDYVRGRRGLPRGTWYITEFTLYEFIRGSSDPSATKRYLEESFIMIYHDNEVLARAAEMWRELRQSGELIDDRDLLIGATAIAKNLPLLTGNKRHFERLKRFKLVLHE